MKRHNVSLAKSTCQLPKFVFPFFQRARHPAGLPASLCEEEPSYDLLPLFGHNHKGFWVFWLRLNAKTSLGTSFLYMLPKIGCKRVRKYTIHKLCVCVYICIKCLCEKKRLCVYIYIYIHVSIYVCICVHIYSILFLRSYF